MTDSMYGCDTCRTTIGRAGCPTHRDKPSPGVNLYITTCLHGLDLRLVPRCYLCRPIAIETEARAGYVPASLSPEWHAEMHAEMSMAEADGRAAALRDLREKVEGLRGLDCWDEADSMCSNCLTPWKCNGPHESPDRYVTGGHHLDRAAVLDLIDREYVTGGRDRG